MEYLSERIGDDYLSWENKFVLLSSHTGSGKTTFILDTLLQHAVNQNKYVLYICNRTILRKQIEVDSEKVLQRIYHTSDLTDEQRNHFIIRTYQYFQVARFSDQIQLSFPQTNPGTISSDQIMYYIWDEAHYLGTEHFNRDYNFWFDCFSNEHIGFPDHPKGTHIFLTATPEPFKYFLAAHLLNQTYTVDHSSPRPYDLHDECRKIYDEFKIKYGLKEKAEQAKKCEEESTAQTSTTPHVKPAACEEEPLSAQYKRWSQHIRPGQNLHQKIMAYVQQLSQGILIEYPEQGASPYQHMDASMFSDLLELVEPIIASQEDGDKWLVFIDNQKDGSALLGALLSHGISAVLLSSNTCHKKGTPAESEYQNIVQSSCFKCSVLIATKVMDCGVNIKDPMVRHIVLSETDRTTALQMLGRKRLTQGEHIHIYFRAVTKKVMREKLFAWEQQLLARSEYAVRNDKDFIPIHSKRSSGSPQRTIACERYKHGNKFNKNQADRVMYDEQALELYSPVKAYMTRTSSDDMLKDYELGKSGFFFLLYIIFEHVHAQEEFDYSNNSLYYLDYQLSWIDQHSSDPQWIATGQLCDKLDEYQSKTIIRTGEKSGLDQVPPGCVDSEAFIDECMSILRNCPSFSNQSANRKHSPGLKAFNKILKELKVPYQMQTKQKSIHGKRYSRWVIAAGPISEEAVRESVVKTFPLTTLAPLPDDLTLDKLDALPISRETSPKRSALETAFQNWEKNYAQEQLRSLEANHNTCPKHSRPRSREKEAVFHPAMIEETASPSNTTELYPDFSATSPITDDHLAPPVPNPAPKDTPQTHTLTVHTTPTAPNQTLFLNFSHLIEK